MTGRKCCISEGIMMRVAQVCVFASVLCFEGCVDKKEQTHTRDGQASFHAGVRALEQNKVSESIRLFKKSITERTANKENAVVYNCLGISYNRLGQREKAIQAFETSIQVNPDLVEPVYNLGVLMLESGQEDTAVKCLEKAVMLDANETEALEYLGHLYRQRREWKKAQRVLNQALQRAPHSSRIITALALLDLQSGEVEKALAGLQQALEYDAGYLPAIYNLAVVNQKWLKNNDQALAYFNAYMRLSPEGPYADKARQAIEVISTAEIPVRPPSFDEMMKVADFLKQNGRREAAVNNYLRAVREAERTAKPDRQKQALREAIDLCSDNARAHYAVGLYFSEHKQTDTAMKHFKQAVCLSTNWYDAQMALAREALKVGEFDTAVVSLKQADQSRPDNAEALWLLSQLYDRNLGLANLAVQRYSQFAQRFPNDYRVGKSLDRLKALKGKEQKNDD